MKKPDGSWEQFDDYVIDFALDVARAGRRFVLVTLVEIDGASPRPLGAQMAVSDTGEWVGYLSGGCIERAVVSEALDALNEMKDRRVRYGQGSKYIDIQLPCGSAIELFFDVSQSIDSWEQVDRRVARRHDTEIVIEQPEDLSSSPETFTKHYRARRRLVILGTGPAAVQLCRLAMTMGMETELMSGDEPTRNYAKSFGAAVVQLTSPRSPPPIVADSRTAIVFMFHDHDWEHALIPAALATDAFYLGALGSRRTHETRVRQLREQGFDEAAIRRIRGPAGIFAGSKSAQDIALSILAEIVQVEHAAEALDAPSSTVRADRAKSRRAAGVGNGRHRDMRV